MSMISSSALILVDEPIRKANLLPLTYTRPIALLRVGLYTIEEKWKHDLHISDSSYEVDEVLNQKYKARYTDDNLFINAGVLPSPNLIRAISNLKLNQILLKDNTWLASRTALDQYNHSDLQQIVYTSAIVSINHPWDIFRLNGAAIIKDVERRAEIISQTPPISLDSSNRIIGPTNRIFIDPSAKIYGATLNTLDGPIYIDAHATIMEGAHIRGPFALASHGVVKMGAKIYSHCTIGPYCKVGGELSNVVFQGYSNKGHDGYLGNSVIGEWCNLGADTNNSNLKNNYSQVKSWNYTANKFIDTGLQFCGLILADHAKSGINTMFNTGTVVGMASNVFGGGFPRNFIPSFSWGGASGLSTYRLDKALETAERVMARRNRFMTDEDRGIWQSIFDLSKRYRS